MSDETSDSGLHIDSDWKAEAAKEKERLAKKEKAASGRERGAGAAAAGLPGFLDLVNVLAMQAAVSLGGLQGPGGEQIPPNAQAAKHHIDLLEVLGEKTAGNLTEEEERVLTRILYELRMQYVQMVSGPPPKGPSGDPASGQVKT